VVRVFDATPEVPEALATFTCTSAAGVVGRVVVVVSSTGTVVVVTSAGVDPDLVPTALDLAEVTEPSARVVLALPPADRLPATERVAALAHADVQLVSVPPPWEPERPGR